MRTRNGCFTLAAALLTAAVGVPGSAQAGDVYEHRVRPGDNLHLIAGYYYKDPRQWRRIWKLNRKHLRDASVLRTGDIVRVEVAPGEGWEIPYEEFVAKVHRRP